MSVHKDKINKNWFVKIKYSDWTGKPHSTTRRGFNRKSDAIDYEANFQLKHAGSATMTFQSMYELYMQDCKHRLRSTTYAGKVFLFESKIIPYFGKFATNEITPAQIRHWQNELMTQNYKETYLKTINNSNFAHPKQACNNAQQGNVTP